MQGSRASTWETFRFSVHLPFIVEYVIVLAAGVTGFMISGWQRRWSLLHAVLLYYVVVHTLWWGEIRNRVYLMPYIIIFAAYTVELGARRWIGRRRPANG